MALAESDCAICHQAVEQGAEGEDAPIFLTCCHRFHSYCIENLLATQGVPIEQLKSPCCKHTTTDALEKLNEIPASQPRQSTDSFKETPVFDEEDDVSDKHVGLSQLSPGSARMSSLAILDEADDVSKTEYQLMVAKIQGSTDPGEGFQQKMEKLCVDAWRSADAGDCSNAAELVGKLREAPAETLEAFFEAFCRRVYDTAAVTGEVELDKKTLRSKHPRVFQTQSVRLLYVTLAAET